MKKTTTQQNQLQRCQEKQVKRDKISSKETNAWKCYFNSDLHKNIQNFHIYKN